MSAPHWSLSDFWMKSAHTASLKGSSWHCFQCHKKTRLYLMSLFKFVQLQLELSLQAELFWSLKLRNKQFLSPRSLGCLQGAQQKISGVKRFDRDGSSFHWDTNFESSFRGNKTLWAVAKDGIIQLILNRYIVLIQSHKIHEHFAFLSFYIEWESKFRVY